MSSRNAQDDCNDRGGRLRLSLQSVDGQVLPELPTRSIVLIDLGEEHVDAAKAIEDRIPRALRGGGVDALLATLRPTIRIEVPVVMDAAGDGDTPSRTATIEYEITSLGDLEPHRILERAALTSEMYRELQVLKALRTEAGRRASAQAIDRAVSARRALPAAEKSNEGAPA